MPIVECIPGRYLLVVLTTIGRALLQMLRLNMSITIVDMTRTVPSVTDEQRGICFNITDGYTRRQGDYSWSNEIQGHILSSYYYGYLVVVIPGGRLCEIFSVKWVFFAGVLTNIIATLLIPAASDIHYGCTIFMRVLEGLGTGSILSATSLILARWARDSEKNIMASILFSGDALGLIVGILIIGGIDQALGWRFVFYITGSFGVPWLIAWAIIAADSPEKSKFMSRREIDFLDASQENNVGTTKVIIIWRNIFKSIPFWALVITHFCSNWNTYLLGSDLPTYMTKVYDYKITTIVFFISGGAALHCAFSLATGQMLDFLRRRKNLSQTWAKKIATLTANVPTCISLFALAYVGCNWNLGTAIIMLMIMFGGATYCGWLSSHSEIGPKIAATLMALTDTVATLSGIIVPAYVGKILDNGTSLESWHIIFCTGAGFCAVLIVVYTIFGTAKPQNYYREEEKEPRTLAPP